VLQGADDARHLRRQDAEDALDVADDHGPVLLEDGEGEELGLLEVASGAAAAEGEGQRELREKLEGAVGQLVEPDRAASGNHGALPPSRPRGGSPKASPYQP